MPGLRPHAAYLLGFTPQLLGVFFNGLLILERTKRGAEGALAERIAWYLESWVPSRGPDVVQNVHLCEALLAEVGENAGEPPQSIDEFYAWSERVNRATYAAAKRTFEAVDEPTEKARLFRVRLAQDLGQQIGDILHTTNLASLVQALLHEAPGDPGLVEQATRFGQAQGQIVTQLEKVLTYTAGYDDIQNQVHRLLAVVRTTPDAAATTDHALVAMQLGDLPHKLDVGGVEKLFMSVS